MLVVNQALILCGGEGTRLHSITGDRIPKPMVKLCNRPALEYQLLLLKKHNINDVILCTGHLGGVIESYFGNGQKFGLRIRYTHEEKQLGTAGAVVQVPFELSEAFFVLYGDVFVNVNLSRMADYYRTKGGEAVLFVHPSEHPYDSDLVQADIETGLITGFPERPKPGDDFVNLASAALYIISSSLTKHISRDLPSDFAKDVFPERFRSGGLLYAYETDEYVHDLGTADRYPHVAADVQRMINECTGSLFRP